MSACPSVCAPDASRPSPFEFSSALASAFLLQARRGEEHACAEVVDVMRSQCADYRRDARELWHRLVFNHLITNIDDHLHNLGFLYVGQNQWRLAPAFDLNPFPDKDRESKTWLSEDTGPITSIEQLLGQAARFELDMAQALQVLAEFRHAVKGGRRVATSTDIRLTEAELEDFAPAFEHEASGPDI